MLLSDIQNIFDIGSCISHASNKSPIWKLAKAIQHLPTSAIVAHQWIPAYYGISGNAEIVIFLRLGAQSQQACVPLSFLEEETLKIPRYPQGPDRRFMHTILWTGHTMLYLSKYPRDITDWTGSRNRFSHRSLLAKMEIKLLSISPSDVVDKTRGELRCGFKTLLSTRNCMGTQMTWVKPQPSSQIMAILLMVCCYVLYWIKQRNYVLYCISTIKDDLTSCVQLSTTWNKVKEPF
jgi:hypothetical protein